MSLRRSLLNSISFFYICCSVPVKPFLPHLFLCFSRLRAELAVLRRRGAVRVGGDAPADPGRTCGRCRAELGRIINRGAVCRSASNTKYFGSEFFTPPKPSGWAVYRLEQILNLTLAFVTFLAKIALSACPT
jgi:hypothetical protein